MRQAQAGETSRLGRISPQQSRGYRFSCVPPKKVAAYSALDGKTPTTRLPYGRNRIFLVSRLSCRCQENSLTRPSSADRVRDGYTVLQLEFHMQSQGRHEHRTAILVIARMVDVLEARSEVDSPPHVGSIVGFHDVLAAIAKRAVTQQETQPAVAKVNLVILANSIGDHRHARTVVSTMPQRAVSAQALGKGLVDFGISKGLRFAVVPSETRESGKVSREILLQVDAEAVLAG